MATNAEADIQDSQRQIMSRDEYRKGIWRLDSIYHGWNEPIESSKRCIRELQSRYMIDCCQDKLRDDKALY